MFTRLLTRSPQFLLFAALVIAGGAGTSCGKMGTGTEANTETASEEVSKPVSKIAVGNRTYDTKEIRAPQVIPSANEKVAVPIGVVFDPSDIKIEPKATPPPPWAPSDAYEALKTNCMDCHYAFRFKESVLENRNRLLASIRANGESKPMPPLSQNPNYTTFRNTAQGKTLIAFLEGDAPPATPTPVPTPWAPVAAYEALRDNCFTCHSTFRYKSSVLEVRSRMLTSIKATGQSMPMPPSTQNPNYTTFRNTTQGQALISFLESAAPTPTSAYSYADVQPNIQGSCVTGCHSTAFGSQVDGLPFDTKERVVANRERMAAALSRTEKTKPYPPNTISQIDKAKLLDWLQNGGSN